MCGNSSYFTQFCGKTGSECECHGMISRKRACLNASCEKMFRSPCGAQLFCSLECQRQTEIGRAVEEAVARVRDEQDKTLRKREQLRDACRRYKRTENGREKRRAQCARYRERHKKEMTLKESGSSLLEQ